MTTTQPAPQLPQTVLCIASHEKGQPFIRECKRQGYTVLFLTTTALQHADWPRESIDQLFAMPDLYNLDDVTNAVSYLARTHDIARIFPLDDFDIETAAALREHLRLPGLGASQARYFRDKLAMRVAASEHGIPVPDFAPVLNYDRLRDFMARVPPPWVLKPRSEASSLGITKLSHADELWPLLDQLGDRQSHHLLERYVPGEVYHVDAIVDESELVFIETHQYGRPPLDVMQGGGLFITRTLPRDSEDERLLKALCRQVITALGLTRGAVHMEFIKGREEGRFYFLETAARVGGANIADMVEAATGINLWVEWARVELAALTGLPYVLPERRSGYAGVVLCLARQEYPDTSAYQDPEIVLRLAMRYHAGLVLASPERDRVEALLDDYSRRFVEDFYTSMPAPSRAAELG